MTESFRKVLNKTLAIVVVLIVLLAFSAFHALRSCESVLSGEPAPPPRYSTRLVLYPGDYISATDNLGLAPGWVVTYASRNKTYGTAFFVSLFGKMKARGEPAIVAKHREQAEGSLNEFKAAFAQADSAVSVGSTFSNAIAILGQPMATTTNDNGFVRVYFIYRPGAIDHLRVDWLTNGFTLVFSNDVVIRKG